MEAAELIVRQHPWETDRAFWANRPRQLIGRPPADQRTNGKQVRTQDELFSHRTELLDNRVELFKTGFELVNNGFALCKTGFEVFRNAVELFKTRLVLFKTHQTNKHNDGKEHNNHPMAAKVYAEKVSEDIDHVLRVWEANPDFKLKDVALADFQTSCGTFKNLLATIAAKELEAASMRNDRDDLASKLNGICTRARSGMKGFFGPNSSQYEQAGGTRAIERKRGSRKAKAVETA